MKWIKALFEDANGVPDEARLAAFLMVLGYLVMSGWSLFLGQPFNPQTWGIGAGALSAGVGGWFGFRKDN